MRSLITCRHGIVAAAAASLALSACGGHMQSAGVRAGTYPVSVDTASFPTSQSIAQSSRLVIAVRNAGRHTIPDVAVTICNVTCRYPAPRGQGAGAPAFGDVSAQPLLANPAQAVWVVERAPGPCGYNCHSGASGGAAVTGATNTWALGRLAPGHTAHFAWTVTAVQPGRHVVAWAVAAGIYGRARAVLAGGGKPQGTFTVYVSSRPAQTYVNNDGAIVNGGSP